MQQATKTSQAKEMQKKEAQMPVQIDLEAAEGQGMEFVTARDQKLPILKILHASSPVLDEGDTKYIEGAKQGDIYSEASGSIWKGKDGIYVVPCLFINTFNEWKDRGDSLGRPVAIHTDPAVLNDAKRGDDNKDRLPNGNYIEDTGNHFVYILDKDFKGSEQALVTMKSTEKKKSKTWLSMINLRKKPKKSGTGFFNPPSWAQVYKLSTRKESNSQYSWYGWVVEFVKNLDESADLKLLQSTNSFYQSAMKSDIFGKFELADEGNVKKIVNSTPF